LTFFFLFLFQDVFSTLLLPVCRQVAYWGDAGVLARVIGACGAPSGLDLELETSEPTPQTSRDIATGRGHASFVAVLRAAILAAAHDAAAAAAAPAAAAASSSSSSSSSSGGGVSSLSAGAAEPPAPSSVVTSTSSAMKAPVPAEGRLCSICYCDDHDAG
jgi:hypothetical protein